MRFDYSKLLGRIKELGFTQEKLAKEAKMTLTTLNAKLKNKSFFNQNEIRKMCAVLSINDGEVGLYFFCLESSENTNIET